MDPIIMQDWTTIRGVATGNVIMSQSDWILTAPYQGVSFYLDVREVTNTVNIAYETAPARDDILFQAMFTSAGGLAVGVAAAVNVVLASPAPSVPVSHWTRWKLLGGASAWDLTFRVMASGNRAC